MKSFALRAALLLPLPFLLPYTASFWKNTAPDQREIASHRPVMATGVRRTQEPFTPSEGTPPTPPRPPRLVVPEAKIPIRLTEANLVVTVTGPLARTAMTLTFRNDNDRVLEGELDFPLPEGAVISGYGLDVNGELVDGVPVEKQAARVAFEKEVRKGVDPGIVENVGGNNFRTRVYPLPAHGTRTVKIEYIADLNYAGGDAAFNVPLNWGQEVPLARVRVEVQQNPVKPVLRFGGRDRDLIFETQGNGYVAEKTFENIRFGDDLTVSLPGTQKERQVAVESFIRGTGTITEHFFVISDNPDAVDAPLTARPTKETRIGIVWDASLSRRGADRQREIALFEKYLRSVGTGEVSLIILRNEPEAKKTFPITPDGIAALVKTVQDAPLDGGTNLSALALTSCERWLVFTDGNGNLGPAMPTAMQGKIYPVSSDSTANHPLLRAIADRSGGAYLNLARLSPQQAEENLREQPFSLLSVAVDSGRVADVFPKGRMPVQGRMMVSGRLLTESATLTLKYGYNDRVAYSEKVTLNRAAATETGLTPRFWARQRTNELAITPEENGEALLAIGRDFHIVTPNTSLIVLETLEQYLEHEITPPKSRTKIYAAYHEAVAKRASVAKAEAADKTQKMIALWRDRTNWWSKQYTYAKNFRYQDKERSKDRNRDTPAVADAEMSPSGGRTPRRVLAGGLPAGAAEGTGASRPATIPAPRSRVSAGGVQRIGQATTTESPLTEEAKKADVSESDAMTAAPSIVLKEWTPDTPYLKAMTAVSAANAYDVYLKQREKFDTSPAFYLDCAEHLMRRGQTMLGLRVLTNLAELRLEDPQLLRILAHRLAQVGYRNVAILIFEKVQKLRPEEPQSFRDLALTLAERAEDFGKQGKKREAAADYNRALELLEKVVMGKWDRFEEIETIALAEANAILVRARTTVPVAALKNPFDSRLTTNQDCDVRILLSWDTDQTDMDLWVTEPSGETCIYNHNRTTIGGRMSKDFTDGYGPEEYCLRRAMPGKYRIQTNYYGSGQQRLTGGTTVQATVITNFGRPNEKRQYLTLRLSASKDTVEVGAIEWKQP